MEAKQSEQPLVFQVNKASSVIRKPSSLCVFMEKYGLSQYFVALEDHGLTDDMRKLLALTETEIDDLLEELGLRPAQVRQFNKMIEHLKRLSRGETSAKPDAEIRGAVEEKKQTSINEIRVLPSTETVPASLDSSQVNLELEEAKLRIQELERRIALNGGLSKSSSGSDYSCSPFSPSDSSSNSNSFEEIKEKPKPNDEAGLSYDSWKMRSALANLDIEEMCRCLAKAVRSHIKHSLSQRNSVPAFIHDFVPAQAYPPLPSVPETVQLSFNQTFNEAAKGSLPDASSIYNFCKNVIVRSRMEKEVTIVSLVYLERLILRTGLLVTEQNWKRLLFTVLIIASKTWDDESFENSNFAEVFTMYSIKEINAMECVFLTLIDYSLTVKGSDYAKYYLLLRTYSEQKNRSFPLKSMDVDTVRRLLKAGRVEVALKDMYREPLYRTL